MKKPIFSPRSFVISAFVFVTFPSLLSHAMAQGQSEGATGVHPAWESVEAGELRLEGKVIGSLGAGRWQIQASSWTSPRGIKTEFPDVKNKTVILQAGARIHLPGQTGLIQIDNIQLGSRIAVIGKNGADGALIGREFILLEGANESKSYSIVTIKSSTARYLNQARTAEEAGLTDRALELYNEGLANAQTIGDHSGEALALKDIGILYSNTGKSAKALETLNRALVAGQGRDSQQASTYNSIGIVYLRDSKFAEAIKAFEKADQLSGAVDTKTRAIYLNNLAQTYAKTKQIDGSYRTLQRLLPLLLENGRSEDATETMLEIALLGAAQKLDGARGFLARAVPRVAQVPDKGKKANFIKAVGLVHWYLGEKDAAKARFEESAKIFETLGDAASAAEVRRIPAQYEIEGVGATPDEWLKNLGEMTAKGEKDLDDLHKKMADLNAEFEKLNADTEKMLKDIEKEKAK